jgi:hypothetical protein
MISCRHVRNILPLPLAFPNDRLQAASVGVEEVDKRAILGIIYLTFSQGGYLGSQGATARQGSFPAPPPCPPSPAPGHPRPGLHLGQPVLRCPRSGPGEVRDAAPCPPGGTPCQPDGHRLRFLPSLFLPGPGPVRAGWSARPAAPAAGTTAGPQALGGDGGAAGDRARRGCHAELQPAGAASGGADGSPGPFPERGASAGQAPAKRGLP